MGDGGVVAVGFGVGQKLRLMETKKLCLQIRALKKLWIEAT
jgi:hypothetical protein